MERTGSGIGETLASRIMYAGSKIRLNNARYLVYSIVDAIVDEHFHQWLVELQGKVHSDMETPLSVVKFAILCTSCYFAGLVPIAYCSTVLLISTTIATTLFLHTVLHCNITLQQAIQQINRDMNMMQFYLRPLKAAVSQLMHDLPEANDVELRRHLEDLLDHVVCMHDASLLQGTVLLAIAVAVCYVVLEEQALRMITWSGSLNNDYLNEQQHRMNQAIIPYHAVAVNDIVINTAADAYASAGCSVLITVVNTTGLIAHGHANFCERIGCATAVVTAAVAVVAVGESLVLKFVVSLAAQHTRTLLLSSTVHAKYIGTPFKSIAYT
eukprot:14948-Heterococcus_DN1.PRE.2